MNGDSKASSKKYCKFLPVGIKFGTKDESVEDGVDKDNKPKYKTITKDRSSTTPIQSGQRHQSELKDEDYLNFYKELYPFTEDPLSGFI